MAYDVQDLAYHGLPVDCGVYGVSFTTTNGPLDPVILDDGLLADPTGIEEGKEERIFTIVETLDPLYRNSAYTVVVNVFLVDYPDNPGISRNFRAQFQIEDGCDTRLVTEGILNSLPLRCNEPEIIKEEPVIEVEPVE